MGAADDTAAVLYPPPPPPRFEIKTGTYSARRRPVRSHRRALPPSARRTTTPAHHSQLCPCSCFSSALDACRCVCLHICGLSADGAVRSAVAPARLAQPRTISFQILRKFDQKSGGRYSGVCGTKAVVFILYHQSTGASGGLNLRHVPNYTRRHF